MTTNDSIAAWGCIASSSAWATQERPLGWVLSAVWLLFAIAIVVSGRRATPPHQGDSRHE